MCAVISLPLLIVAGYNLVMAHVNGDSQRESEAIQREGFDLI